MSSGRENHPRLNPPAPFLRSLVGGPVAVKLKWGLEYHGTLKSVDSYMNILLMDSDEWVAGVCKGRLGQIFIRCNNVLYVRELAGATDEPQDM